MLARVARFTVRRPRLVLVASALFLAAAAVVGGGVAEHLTSGGFENRRSESFLTAEHLRQDFGVEDPNLVLLVRARAGTVDDSAVAEIGRRVTARLAAEPHVAHVISYWSLGQAPPLRSTDGRQALVLATIEGTDDEVDDRAHELVPRHRSADATVEVAVGGFAAVFDEVGSTIERDLLRAESIAVPVTLLLLVFVFGSVVAASLPLAIGVLSVLGTFAILRLVTAMTDVSIFALNLVTAMSLGLAIDYGLFMVSRFREELRGGWTTPEAVLRTVDTAGRTVLFSGLTVAVSLAALLVFPLSFLRSFAYAGIGVVLVAVGGALATLPALLALLGPRVDRLMLWRRSTRPPEEGAWHRIALAVMHRPVRFGAAVVVLLLVLGGPFLDVRFGLPDDRVLPADAPSREVSEHLRRDFASNEPFRLSVLAHGIGDPDARAADVEAYAAALSGLPGAARVDALTGSYVDGIRVAPPGPAHEQFRGDHGTWLAVAPGVEPFSDAGEDVVRDIRALGGPFPVTVTGPSAELVDEKAALFARMPLAVALIAAATFVLLFLMFGSVVVPVKALLLNLLSLTATFGAMVWVFQEGNLGGLLDFTSTGTIDTSTPILMFCIAFGLSMDYEVFLLSRIKEEYDRTGDNTRSVAVGLERTGRIVTAAALLLALVFSAFATSDVTFIKMFGVGLTLAILVDATLVRGVLVPAFMRLAGRANWWAPGPLRRLHDRLGFAPHVSATEEDQEMRRRRSTTTSPSESTVVR